MDRGFVYGNICLDADGTIIDTLSVEAIYYVGAFQQLGFDFVKNVDDLKKLYCNNYFEECKKHKIDQETVGGWTRSIARA